MDQAGGKRWCVRQDGVQRAGFKPELFTLTQCQVMWQNKHSKPTRHVQFDATFSTPWTEDQTHTEPSPSKMFYSIKMRQLGRPGHMTGAKMLTCRQKDCSHHPIGLSLGCVEPPAGWFWCQKMATSKSDFNVLQLSYPPF